jgi:hypothetical protein
MVKVLIPTKPDDAHALYVKLALERKGHEAVLWYIADFPEQQMHSFRLHHGAIEWMAHGLDFAVQKNDEFDVVWLRRPQKPIVPDFLHADDRANAQRENNEFFKYMWQVIAPYACWINSPAQQASANCKLRQLQAAVMSGLAIPASLFSNDPEQIKSFIEANRSTGVIYKPVFPVFWVTEDTLRLTYTREITDTELPHDLVLQATPGIYQQKINKAYELRVTMFGEMARAVKLDSQTHPHAKIDWRSVSCFEIPVTEYQLPEKIREQCSYLLKLLGLKFGCFDLIVTPEGEYYFLEVNEQGQFLWIEEVNPLIKMLDTFSNFLIAAGGGSLSTETEIVSMKQFDSTIRAMQQCAMQTHKDAGLYSA